MTVTVATADRITTVTIDRPAARNAVDPATAQALYDAFRAFEADEEADIAILTGAGGYFCAGFDLKSADAVLFQPIWFDLLGAALVVAGVAPLLAAMVAARRDDAEPDEADA